VLNTALPAGEGRRLQPLHTLSLDEPRPRGVGGAGPAATDGTEADHPAGFAVHWRESREIAGPEIVSMGRNFKRNGLPVVHLWQSDRNMVAIGLNPHGLPGIYFTRHLADQ